MQQFLLQETEHENNIHKMSAILLRLQWVNN